jgi:lipopolysaccharide/colanic/teichoic acid biosynthesis glycosyltransferase
LLIVLWRLHLSRIIGVRKRQNALFIGNGSEVQELIREIDGNDRYHMRAALRLAPEEVEHSDRLQEQILAVVEREGISIIVADTRDESIRALLPVIYNLIFLHASFSFVDTSKLYETIFARVPLSSLRYSWFLDSFRFGPRLMYDFLKRIFDFTVGAAAGAVMLGLLPIVWAAIRFEDGGPLFIRQERVGEGSHPMHIVKFRTMSGNDQGSSVLRSALTITRTGRFLRKTRLDELPQAWNLIRGDLSFVGPRPELPALATEYARAIPYYNARHLIKPGLTGWAQIYHEQHPHHGIDVDETKNKLSYDLYYIKNRSFLLDMQIALKTIRTILSRSGA